MYAGVYPVCTCLVHWNTYNMYTCTSVGYIVMMYAHVHVYVQTMQHDVTYMYV